MDTYNVKVWVVFRITFDMLCNSAVLHLKPKKAQNKNLPVKPKTHNTYTYEY